MGYWVLLRGGERDGDLQSWEDAPSPDVNWVFPRPGHTARNLKYRWTGETVTLPDGLVATVLEFDG
jgi:hypothetical protein